MGDAVRLQQQPVVGHRRQRPGGYTPEILQSRKEQVIDALQLRGMPEKYQAILRYRGSKR
jgi:hypothetical protein